MRRSRKLILIGLLAIVVLAGSIGGVVFAQTEDGDDSQPQAQYGAMLDKVCEIYENNTGVAINPEELQKAFDQARSDIMAEARENFRQRLIDEGKITQEQFDEFDKWLESKPDVPFPFGPRNHGGIRPFGGGFRGFHRFGGPCFPPAPTE